MRRYNTPRTHISVMNNHEQSRVPEEVANHVRRKWLNKMITFSIEKVQIWRHVVKETGDPKLVCCFKVKSAMIEEIRMDLGWTPTSEQYNMHMSVSKKSLQ